VPAFNTQSKLCHR